MRWNPDPVMTIPPLHADQVRAFETLRDSPYKVLRAGRRWGKTAAAISWGAEGFAEGELVGWFAPDHKRWSEAYMDILNIVEPMRLSSSKGAGSIRGRNGGRFDFWTLDDISAGRSRYYSKVIIDEAAFTNPATMMAIWEKAIKPTLFDTGGECLVCSNTNGNDTENFMYRICNDPKYGFRQYHAPTHNNPMLPKLRAGEAIHDWMKRRARALAKLKADNHPLVYQQEYLAQFVDWSGIAFFDQDKWMVDGKPVEKPVNCDVVFAVIDTAVKDGFEHDGTAVVYFGIDKTRPPGTGKLVVLDWDIIKIEGSILEAWLPSVYTILEGLAKECGARGGSAGVFIEDKASGTILLQQAKRRGWRAHPIDTELTSKGKDGRAMSVSGYHYRGLCKISEHAFKKVVTYNNVTRNHFSEQVKSFRIGDKDAAKREDDLLDAYTYGLSIALGNSEGW